MAIHCGEVLPARILKNGQYIMACKQRNACNYQHYLSKEAQNQEKSTVLLTWAATNMLPQTKVTWMSVSSTDSCTFASFIVTQLTLHGTKDLHMWESEKSFSKRERVRCCQSEAEVPHHPSCE